MRLLAFAVFVCVSSSFGGLLGVARGAESGVRAPAKVPRQPYFRSTVEDGLGREVTHYLSEEPDGGEPLPVLLYVHGSSWQSLFVRAGGRVRGQHGHSSLADACRGRMRLLLVEKPGIEYLEAAPEATSRFREEHSLERWTVALTAALDATLARPDVDSSRVFVLGHSEGGLVAARLARIHPAVTHVGLLAGGGPTQLFDLLQLAREGRFFMHVSPRAEDRAAYLIEKWQHVMAEPDLSRVWFGHSHARWASFLRSSPMEELEGSAARVLLAQGVEDQAVSVASFDVLHAHLLSKGREVEAWRLPGLDHDFAGKGPDGGRVSQWADVLRRCVDWALVE